MAEHTPGPWVWGSFIEELPAEDASRTELVAYGPKDEYGTRQIIIVLDIAVGDTIRVSPANARLIAAAPDLLAALKDARGVLAELYHDDPCGFYASKLRTCDIAIAKAEVRS